MEILEIAASLRPADPVPTDWEPRQVMNRLLDKGFELMVLGGELWREVTDGESLFVEDDAQILLRTQRFAEAHSAPGISTEFDCFLGEGRLISSSRVLGDRVELELRQSPTDGSGGGRRWSGVIDSEHHRWWWRSMAAPLILAASDHPR